jgi:resuscitation-promoting factor RpfA
MTRPPRLSRIRRTLLVAAVPGLVAAAAGFVLVAAAAAADVRRPGPAAPDDVLALVAAAGCAAALAWLATTLAFALAVALRGRTAGGRLARLERAVVPAVVRRLTAALVGASLVTGGAAPALAVGLPAAPPAAAASPVAAATDPGWAAPGPATDVEAGRGVEAQPGVEAERGVEARGVEVGWVPTPPPRPVRTAGDSSGHLLAPAPRPAVSADATVVVRRGDTLWDLARRHLGGDATDAEVAAEWPRWHAANRAVIGADADLLHPGQRLVPPAAAPA